MIADGKTSRKFEELKDSFGSKDGFRGAVEEDQCVVSVLKNGAWLTRNKGVMNASS